MYAQETNAEQSAQLKWWDLGACKGLDAAMFYPDDEASAVSAKAVCEMCAVRSACLEHALTIREKAGVWGGATERDRRRIIRQRRKTA
jgi:WhiB family redox-sensing transcriptional regulator